MTDLPFKTIQFVYTESKSDYNKYIQAFNTGAVKIDYNDVYNKLIKNDVLNHEPSDILINLDIIRRLKNACNKKEVKYVIYKLKSLDSEYVTDLKELMSNQLEQEDIRFEVVSVNNEVDTESFEDAFHKIYNIELS